MEYKINNFNLSDIEFKDTKDIADYFEKFVFKQKVKNLLIGPNIINIKYPNEKKVELEENKRIINTLCRLILHNIANTKADQAFMMQSSSNSNSKSYLKKIFKELDSLLADKNVTNRQAMYQSVLFYDFLSLFTCIRDADSEEVPICDYALQFNNINGSIKLGLVETFQESVSLITNKSPGLNNIHIFYMLMYNLPVNELKDFLLCDKTKNYFTIFTEDIDVDDFVKRYIFLNQFKLIKNERQFEEFSKAEDNVDRIKKEFEFYKNLYISYISMKDFLGIDAENEKRIFEVFFAILLISEYEVLNDQIANNILEKIKTNKEEDSFTMVQNHVFSDFKFKLNAHAASQNKASENMAILQKISMNLNVSEEKVSYILMMDVNNHKVTLEKRLSQKTKDNLIKLLFNIFMDKIKVILQNYNQNNDSENRTKLTFLITRSNLVYRETCLSSHIIQTENGPMVKTNVREILLNNYIQELKNFFFYKNSLSVIASMKDYAWPTVSFNESFLDKTLNEHYNYSSLLEVFENQSLGLLKVIEDSSLVPLLKQNFNMFLKKDIIEIVDLNYLKIAHSFGTCLYDLSQFAKEAQSKKKVAAVEETVLKFLEYKPLAEFSQPEVQVKFFRKLSHQIVYISYLIKVGRYKVVDILNDYKLNHIYYFYCNFFNYIINMQEIRKNLVKDKMLAENLKKDDLSLFKNLIAKRVRISNLDFYFDNGYIYARNNFNRILDFSKNISNMIFKYNPKMFYYLIVRKLSYSTFNHFKFAINAVRAYIKLHKIYQEKKVVRQTKNLILDVLTEHYPVFSIVDQIHEINFSFEKETFPKILPKLLFNLNFLKKVWKNYIADIIYLEKNKSKFTKSNNVESIIEDRLVNFRTLLFLFSKRYNYSNIEHLKKNGILHSEFTKSIANEALSNMIKLYKDMLTFLEENEFKYENNEIINFQNLLTRRNSIQEQKVEKKTGKDKGMNKSASMIALQDNLKLGPKQKFADFSFKYDYTAKNLNLDDNEKESKKKNIFDNRRSVDINKLSHQIMMKTVLDNADNEGKEGYNSANYTSFGQGGRDDMIEDDEGNKDQEKDKSLSPLANNKNSSIPDYMVTSEYASSDMESADMVQIKKEIHKEDEKAVFQKIDLLDYGVTYTSAHKGQTYQSEYSSFRYGSNRDFKIKKTKSFKRLSTEKVYEIEETSEGPKIKDINKQIPKPGINSNTESENKAPSRKSLVDASKFINSPVPSGRTIIDIPLQMNSLKPKVEQSTTTDDKEHHPVVLKVPFIICNENNLMIEAANEKEIKDDNDYRDKTFKDTGFVYNKKTIAKKLNENIDKASDRLLSEVDLLEERKYYHSDKANTGEAYIQLTKLQELDSQIEQLKMSLSSLDLIEAITDTTSKLIWPDLNLQRDRPNEKTSHEFYEEIRRNLQTAKDQLFEK